MTQRAVLGSVHGSIMCGCLHVVDVLASSVQILCSCSEERDVLGPLPASWICPACTDNRHELYGVRLNPIKKRRTNMGRENDNEVSEEGYDPGDDTDDEAEEFILDVLRDADNE